MATIGICTPIPLVPINAPAIQRDRLQDAWEAVDQLNRWSTVQHPPDHQEKAQEELRKAWVALQEAIAAPYSDEKHLGLMTPEWMRIRMNLVCPMGHSLQEIYVDGMEVGQARCFAVNQARRARVKYLFFLDWDVIPPQDVLNYLVYHLENNPEVDVASGMYCGKWLPPYPMFWKDWSGGVCFDWAVTEVQEKVVGIPMGCALIRMTVFDRLSHDEEKPWFKTTNESTPTHVKRETEDMWFLHRAQEECQAKILIDTTILCGHIDPKTGLVYTLPRDSLPVRRFEEHQHDGGTNGKVMCADSSPTG